MVTRAAIRSRSGGAGEHRPFGLSGVVQRLAHAGVAVMAAALLLIACAACAPSTSSPDAEIRSTIVRYNRLLAEGYRLMDMSALREVATEAQAESEYIHMSAVGEGGVRLLPRLISEEFVDISVEGTAAVVVTRETWEYAHESNPGRDLLLVQRGLVYDLAWDLVKADDGLWYVDDIRSVSATSTSEPQRFGMPMSGAR